MQRLNLKAVMVCFLSALFIAMSFVACGSSGSEKGGYNNGSYMTSDSINSFGGSSYSSDYYDYSSGTYISGSYADYSYNFSAEGKTKKTQQHMLDYYEELQELVIESGGYMDTVNNNYNRYEIDPTSTYYTRMEKTYIATGRLRFNIQIPNESVETVLNSLKDFCDAEGFTITGYSQYIKNYENYEVVDDDYDIEWYERDEKITESELAYRLKYASFSVDIYYYTLRGGFEKFWLGLKESWHEFWDGVGSIIVGCLGVGVGLLVFFFEGIIFYRVSKRVAYNNRKRHPQYYPPKEIQITREEE